MKIFLGVLLMSPFLGIAIWSMDADAWAGVVVALIVAALVAAFFGGIVLIGSEIQGVGQ